MAVKPVGFHLDGTVDLWHDERQHGGSVALADIPLGLDVTGAPDLGTAVLTCPVPGCVWSSWHPPGGGADPEGVQPLHALKLMQAVPGRTWAQARTILRVRILQNGEGLERYRLATVQNP